MRTTCEGRVPHTSDAVDDGGEAAPAAVHSLAAADVDGDVRVVRPDEDVAGSQRGGAVHVADSCAVAGEVVHAVVVAARVATLDCADACECVLHEVGAVLADAELRERSGNEATSTLDQRGPGSQPGQEPQPSRPVFAASSSLAALLSLGDEALAALLVFDAGVYLERNVVDLGERRASGDA